MTEPDILLNDLLSELAVALGQDSGLNISSNKLKALLLEEAQCEVVVLADADIITIEQMWLLFSGWKLRIGQAYGLLSGDPAMQDFWEQHMPETRAAFSRLSRKVVHGITRSLRQHERETGVSISKVMLSSVERDEPLQQSYTRAAFQIQGLRAIGNHP